MGGIGDACNWNGKSNVSGSKGQNNNYKDAKIADSQSYQVERLRMAPIQKLASKDVPLSQKPVIFSHEFRKAEANTTQAYEYSNLMNNFDGSKTILDAEGNVVQNLDIKGKALSAAQTTMAFTLNDNDNSTLTLSEKSQNWGENFTFVDGDSSGKVDEKEYFAMINNYQNDAQSKLGSERVLNETVKLDENTINDQKALFAAMAGEDGVLTKDEYVKFNEGLMALGTKDENGNTTITGAQFKNYVNAKVGVLDIAMNASPSSVSSGGKTQEAKNEAVLAEQNPIPSKKEFLSKYNLDIDPNIIHSFNSTDKGIELTLNDGTVIKNNWKDGYKPVLGGSGSTPAKIYYDEGSSLVFEGLQGYRANSTDKTAGNRTLRIFPGDTENIAFKNCKNFAYQSTGDKIDNVMLDNTKGSMFIMGGGSDMITANNSTRNDIRRSAEGSLTVAGEQLASGKEGTNHIAVDAGVNKNGQILSKADDETQKLYGALFRKSTLDS